MRRELKKLRGGQHQFLATIVCYDTKLIKGKSIDMVCLKHVFRNGRQIADHVWVFNVGNLKELNLPVGTQIQFIAFVRQYIKGGKETPRRADYSLTGPTNIQIIKEKKENKDMDKTKNYKMVKYTNDKVELNVRFDFENKTVWLTQKEIALICGVGVATINNHLARMKNETKLDLQVQNCVMEQNGREVKIYNSTILQYLKEKISNNNLVEFLEWSETIFASNDFEKMEIVRFTQDNLSLEVRFTNDYENAWLNQDEIARLFKTTVQNISMHINNILEQGELEKVSVVKNSLNTGLDNKRYQVSYYSLDMILSIGYRVNSGQGIAFRRWANSVLKDYLIKGYAINERRMVSLGKTVEIQNKMLATTLNVDYEELASVVKEYTNALDLLDDYDHQRVSKPAGRNTIYELTYSDCRSLIDSMKFNQDSTLFGKEKEEGKLEGILAAVYMEVFGQPVYPSLEDKAAHLLYFLVKDHPFYDGCKRIAATIFLEFLNKNNALVRNGKLLLSNDALVAITLLTAESNPDEIEIIIAVITNMLAKAI